MATDDSRVFLDTNVLLSACDADRASHGACVALLEAGLSGKRSLYASGQILREFLVVATRPVENNGLGMSPEAAVENLGEFRRCAQILEESARVAERLAGLVKSCTLRGKRIHDANVVATMLEHGLTSLVTGNGADFAGMAEVTSLTPEELAAAG